MRNSRNGAEAANEDAEGNEPSQTGSFAAAPKGVVAHSNPDQTNLEPRRYTDVGPEDMRDLVGSVMAAIEDWARRRNYPSAPPYLVLRQMMKLLEAQFRLRNEAP